MMLMSSTSRVRMGEHAFDMLRALCNFSKSEISWSKPVEIGESIIPLLRAVHIGQFLSRSKFHSVRRVRLSSGDTKR